MFDYTEAVYNKAWEKHSSQKVTICFENYEKNFVMDETNFGFL